MALTKVQTSGIADDAVTTDKLANAINTERTANTAKVSLADDAVTSAKIADDAVVAAAIADDAVVTAAIADDAVVTASIADNAITNALMADDAVGVAELSATGTASSSTYLRGDNSWAAAGGLSSDAQSNTVGGTDAGGEFSGTDATNNTLIGHDAGKKISTGDWNVAIGDSALTGNGTATTGSSNTAIGPQAMHNGTSVADCVAVGSAALYSMTTGTHNVAVGRLAGYTNSTGHRNTFIGQEAGKEATSNDSVYVGRQSGISISTGTGQVMIGDNAGKGCQTGSYNVCLGLQAGKDQISADHSHRLWIARSDTPAGNGATWIYGSDGGACTQGNNSSSWTTTSDQRLKKAITDNTVGLSVIDNVKVRNYKYKQYTKTPEQLYDINDTEVQNGTKTIDDIKVARSFAPVSSDDVVDISEFPKAGGDVGKVVLGQGKSAVPLGVVAQELESVAPNCVITDDNGVKSVDTDELFWHMLNAIKELSTKVKALEAG